MYLKPAAKLHLLLKQSKLAVFNDKIRDQHPFFPGSRARKSFFRTALAGELAG